MKILSLQVNEDITQAFQSSQIEQQQIQARLNQMRQAFLFT